MKFLTEGPWLTALIAGALALVIFRRQVTWLLKLLGRSALWLAALALAAQSGLAVLGVNCLNALALGLLGLPGLGLLLLLRWAGT